jgi:hypothetical protein
MDSLRGYQDDALSGRTSRWSPIAAGLVAALVIAPFALLTLSAVPQADDFCYAIAAQAHGLWDGTLEFYGNWTGRFFSSLLIMLPSAMAGPDGAALTAAVQGVSLVMLLAVFGLALWTMRLLFPRWPWGLALLAAFVFLAAILGNIRSARDLLYWVSGHATYAIPAILSAGLYVWLHVEAAARRRLSPPWLAGLCPLVLLVSGANEFTGPGLALIAAAGMALRSRLGARPQPGFHGALILAACAGFALVLAAPGNHARLEVAAGGDILETIVWAPIYFLNFAALRIDMPGFFGWLILVWLAAGLYQRRYGRPGDGAPGLVFIPLAVLLAYGLTAFAAGVFGIGSILPARAQNQVLLTAMVLGTVAVAEAARLYGASLEAWLRRRLPALTPGRLAAAGLLLLALSPQALQAWYTALVQAPVFEAEARGHLQQLAAAPRERVELEPLSAKPELLVQEWIQADPDHWVNRCVADYFGHGQVAVSR